ncbi:TRAP transporter small permease [Halomonas sp. NO4]|uniref:TRAP transporter small permease n=1 Tax=Halomonas sp. NO4 TaxID=2484813 RepID=UPI0013D18BC1|nr:TRAP transporter small permease [Halomonas sp. NO4]
MHKLLGLLERLERAIDAVIQPAVFAGMAALIAVITLQIVSRVFFTAVGWTEEVARFLLVWITFLGATLAFQRGRHIAVTFVVEALPSRLRHFAQLLAILAGLAFLIALTVVGQRYMLAQSFQKSASLRLSMTWVYAVIPISAALMSGYAVVDLVRLLVRGPDDGKASDRGDSEELPP